MREFVPGATVSGTQGLAGGHVRCLLRQPVGVQFADFSISQPCDGIGHGGKEGEVAREFVFFGPDGKAVEEALGAAVNMRDFFVVDNGGFAGNMLVGFIGRMKTFRQFVKVHGADGVEVQAAGVEDFKLGRSQQVGARGTQQGPEIEIARPGVKRQIGMVVMHKIDGHNLPPCSVIAEPVVSPSF